MRHTRTRLGIPLLALAAALLSTAPVLAGKGGEQPPPREIAVHGEGRVSATPDEASVSLGVQARSPDLAAARADVSRRTAAVLAHLGGLGIAPEHINASALTLRPEYRWDKESEEQVLRGYLVERRIDVRLEELARLGELLEGAADAGANQVSPPVLGHSQEGQLRRQALAAAARDARANAAAIAASLDAELGAVRSVSALQGGGPVPVAREMMLRAADSAPPGETYATGDLVFESRVSATFDIDPVQP